MIKPEGYRVLIKPVKLAEKTDGGIYLSDQGREKLQRAQTEGVVVALGPRCDISFSDHELKPGDKIQFVQYAGVDYFDPELPDEIFWIINDQDVVGLIC